MRVGDILLAINAHKITDVLDYRFYLAERHVTLTLRRGEERREVTIVKGEYDDIGLDFATPLMDEKHACRNKCIFCFIDQLPAGLRDTLYFKDDDSRLSFLHGNYITLTNLYDRDIDRIIDMHISPVRVSVHTTDPDLRCRMMHNKRAGEVLSYLRRIADARLSLQAQIVLCRGINDGEALRSTMRDLYELAPALGSVSIVPAGLTKFRDGLYPLEPYTPEECREILAMVDAFAEECRTTLGTRLFFCADELYLAAGLPLPPEDYYEDYAQLENGVGMLRSLCEEFAFEMDDLAHAKAAFRAPRSVSVATGTAAYDTIRTLADRLMAAFAGLAIRVYEIQNDFFGHSITVSGLLTGVDVARQLTGRALGDELLIPANMLRAERDLFLCGMTPEELSEKLGVPVRPVEADGGALFAALLGIENEW